MCTDYSGIRKTNILSRTEYKYHLNIKFFSQLLHVIPLKISQNFQVLLRGGGQYSTQIFQPSEPPLAHDFAFSYVIFLILSTAMRHFGMSIPNFLSFNDTEMFLIKIG